VVLLWEKIFEGDFKYLCHAKESAELGSLLALFNISDRDSVHIKEFGKSLLRETA